jgi:D-3-phosphoglycerate dehydrogenase
MKQLKIVVTDYIEPDLEWEAREMAQRGLEFVTHQLKFAPESDVAAATHDADVVIVNMLPITPAIISKWEKCSLVIRHGVGYDNVDVAALQRAGISFCYIPDYCADEVAEQAIMLLFACGRRLPASRRALERSSARGAWDFAETVPIFRMTGQTLGIIGCGRIGSRVYLKLRSFGFNFLICDPYLTDERKKELGIEVVDQETVFRDADFITIHTPLTPETRHLANERTLALMKPTAYLVNTSRGPMVDVPALAAALKSGVPAGAAIDVFDVEPPPPDYPLFGLPNVILTPHLSWYSEDAGRRIRELIVLEVDRFLAGQPPRFTAKPT